MSPDASFCFPKTDQIKNPNKPGCHFYPLHDRGSTSWYGDCAGSHYSGQSVCSMCRLCPLFLLSVSPIMSVT